jgi:tryptophan 2,3-dioxygenase
MTPMSFAGFRDRLETSSGFQSAQFREFEFVVGVKRTDMIKHCDQSTPSFKRLQERLHERSVVDHFYDFLAHRGVEIPPELRNRDLSESTKPNGRIQEGVYNLYVSQPDVASLFELMTDFDEGQQEWRYRHIKVVERTIGNKQGTGGSLGVEFLKKTLFQPIFPDLWAIRHKL